MSDAGDSEQPTVLVVEDEPPLVEIYARWLERRYTVRTAQSGSEALEQLDGEVDVALLDRLMPGMSGDEVLEEIERRVPDCKVAMVTAVEPDFDVLTMGFDDYLTKPVNEDELIATVERLLSRTSFADLERELYSLVSKRAALQSAKPEEELTGSEEYRDLEERIQELKDRLDETLPEMADGEFVAMVRDIDEAGEEGRGGGPRPEDDVPEEDER